MAEKRQRVVELQLEDVVLRDLRVTFSVERTLRPTPNRAEVVAYNVAPADRARLVSLASRGVRVSLRAGYRGGDLAQVFRGDVRRVLPERQGAEVALRLSAGDGLAALSGRMPALSFGAGTSLGAVLRRVVGESGLDPGNALELARGALSGLDVGDGGLSLPGSPARALAAVTARAGLEWSVQDGQVQVLPAGGALATRAVLLAGRSGLVGAPTEDELGVLDATCLLEPAVVPGALVRLESPDLSGEYRVESVTYEGDTHGQPWYCRIRARRPRG